MAQEGLGEGAAYFSRYGALLGRPGAVRAVWGVFWWLL